MASSLLSQHYQSTFMVRIKKIEAPCMRGYVNAKVKGYQLQAAIPNQDGIAFGKSFPIFNGKYNLIFSGEFKEREDAENFMPKFLRALKRDYGITHHCRPESVLDGTNKSINPIPIP